MVQALGEVDLPALSQRITARLGQEPAFRPVFQAIIELFEVRIVARDYSRCIKEYRLRAAGNELSSSQLKRQLNWLVFNGLVTRLPYQPVGNETDPDFSLRRVYYCDRRGIYDGALDEWWIYMPTAALRAIERQYVEFIDDVLARKRGVVTV